MTKQTYTPEEREKILNEQSDIIKEDLASFYFKESKGTLNQEEAYDIVYNMNNRDLYHAIGEDKGLIDYDIKED